MDFETLDKKITEIDRKFSEISDLMQQLKMTVKYSKPAQTDHKMSDLRNANRMRYIYSLFAKGYNSWQIAELAKDDFESVWSAYDFIANYRQLEKTKIYFARAYLISTLAKNGMTYSEISKIAGCTRARCSQIVHSFKN